MSLVNFVVSNTPQHRQQLEQTTLVVILFDSTSNRNGTTKKFFFITLIFYLVHNTYIYFLYFSFAVNVFYCIQSSSLVIQQ
jgi:hypothetical protein